MSTRQFTEADYDSFDDEPNVLINPPVETRYALQSGYAYSAHALAAIPASRVPNDDFETIVYTPTGTEIFCCVRNIDDTPCAVFVVAVGPSRSLHIAQTVVSCRVS